MRWLVRGVIVAGVAVALSVGWCVYDGIATSLHAEHGLHAALLTVELLSDHVHEHSGQWPHSWTDLEELPPRRRGMFQWPEDSKEVQRYVTVDFAADPQEILSRSAEEFDAVRPIGPYYPFMDSGPIAALLEAIREHHRKEAVDDQGSGAKSQGPIEN